MRSGQLQLQVSHLFYRLIPPLIHGPVASRNFALKALERAGAPLPKAGIITSNDVARGKPHPDPYEAAARLLGVEAKNCECYPTSSFTTMNQSPSRCRCGRCHLRIKAGNSSGAHVLGVCTSTSRDVLLSSDVQPDFVLANLAGFVLRDRSPIPRPLTCSPTG